jgi:hypothetical protein
MATLGAFNPAEAAPVAGPAPTDILRANSFADLLEPIPAAVALLQAVDENAPAASRDENVQLANHAAAGRFSPLGPQAHLPLLTGAGGRSRRRFSQTWRRLLLSALCGTLRGYRNHALNRVVICENACVRSSYVCELIHYVREPQLHVALRPRAPPSRDDAQLDDDDERRRDDERRLSDDAPAPDASAISPSEFLPFFDD